MIFITISSVASSRSFFDYYNRFDIPNRLIPKEKIIFGGPRKDGIPAIINPIFENADKVYWLKDNDLVAGIEMDGVFKAYPLRILVWHEAVNDRVADRPILVSYCPLCGSTITFDRYIDSQELTFGISGLLYQSDVLYYDHQSLSLWSQLEMKAISCPKAGTDMEVIPSVLATWNEWKSKYPDTLVLSKDSGFLSDYDNIPYGGYESSGSILLPVDRKDDRYHPKEKVLVAISTENISKAYAFKELKKIKTPLKDKVGSDDLIIKFNDSRFVTAYDNSGIPVKCFVTYWFAWYTFRPDTLVFKARESG